MSENSIDAVVTWVDGNDEDHRRKRSRYAGTSPTNRSNELVTGRDETRFLDNGEIRYCLLSILRFAPWIRTIHLVTDNQIPDFLDDEWMERNRVRLVDHTEIFRSHEWALPTFNSRSIETALWRIPGLAARFIYFNDDTLLTGTVHPEDFFIDEKVVLRGKWIRSARFGPLRLRINDIASRVVKRLFGVTRSMHHLMQIRSAQLAGFSTRYYKAPHIPHPIRTNTLNSYFQTHPEQFDRNISYRFRNTDQFSSIHLANHLEIASDRAVLADSDDHLMINGEMDPRFMIRRKLKRFRNGTARMVCLQGIERMSQSIRHQLLSTLESVVNPHND